MNNNVSVTTTKKRRELGKIAGKFCNTNYCTLTKDFHMRCVPDKLSDLWYSKTNLSIVSLMFREIITGRDLEIFGNDLNLLETKLKKEFFKLSILRRLLFFI